MSFVHGLRFDNIRGDIYRGVTAAVVALPLALAFAGIGVFPIGYRPETRRVITRLGIL